MIEVSNLKIQYANRRPVVEDFNLSVKAGQIVSIVGESGSGKSTVLRALLGALPENGKVTAGDIRFEGESILGYSKKEWQQYRGKKTAMIFQDSGAMLNPIRKIGSQIVEYLRLHEKLSKDEAWEKGKEALSMVRLPDSDNTMKAYPFELSGGMRQRVGIAMAMALNPGLLLADEPTAALDVTTQAQIVRLMLELMEKQDAGIVMVTHNLGVAAYMSDYILVMQNGKIVESGKAMEIVQNPQSDYTRTLIETVPRLGGKRYV
ncbi:MAG: peptide/nickel transport system ATP-binding protein [Eubacteriaceae bacterium]|jgi:peptide/nickel transport system ATP-binding protein|nr:peptide/nickel transport system ATP-binding protein [Eubacteriaceae bacterium]